MANLILTTLYEINQKVLYEYSFVFNLIKNDLVGKHQIYLKLHALKDAVNRPSQTNHSLRLSSSLFVFLSVLCPVKLFVQAGVAGDSNGAV